jgi:hypothetical protein
MAGGVAQGLGPEFMSQYYKKKKRKEKKKISPFVRCPFYSYTHFSNVCLFFILIYTNYSYIG